MKKEFTNGRSIAQFESLAEFYKYICATPFNEAFRFSYHGSVEYDENFTETKSFDEAVDLMKNGWNEMANKITKSLEVKEKKTAYVNKRKNVTSMVGYQPIVPLYLAGAPNNMVSTKMVPVKQKVVNITKSLAYSAMVSKDQIIEESIKAMQIVRKLEAIGYRVNLNLVIGSAVSLGFGQRREILIKVCLKKANERLNISKLAFPMVHPSMLRRLYLRYIEVCPETTKGYVNGYGRPIQTQNMKQIFPDDIIIPAILNCKIDDIHTVDDLVKKC